MNESDFLPEAIPCRMPCEGTAAKSADSPSSSVAGRTCSREHSHMRPATSTWHDVSLQFNFKRMPGPTQSRFSNVLGVLHTMTHDPSVGGFSCHRRHLVSFKATRHCSFDRRDTQARASASWKSQVRLMASEALPPARSGSSLSSDSL